MIHTKAETAWRIVVGDYPGWTRDTEVWVRQNGDGTVDVAALDHALDSLTEPSARGNWRRYLVGDLASAREVEGATYGGRILSESNERHQRWQDAGFERLTIAARPLDALALLKLYALNASSAWQADESCRRFAAARARSLVFEVEELVATGALDFGYPDHATAVEDLRAIVEGLTTAERELAAGRDAT